MSKSFDLSSLDLAALISSRLCHDIISPVGAIINGLEVLDEEGNEDMKDFAMDLIRKSAGQASAKLQFARLAFGAAGSAGAEIDLGDAQSVAEGFMAGEKPDLVWDVPRLLMAKNKVKLLLNMILVANQCIPRGGTVTVSMTGDAENPVFKFTSQGKNARIPIKIDEVFIEEDTETVDAHSIQPIYTWLLARECGLKVELESVEESVTISVR
ncbi:MAG: histidine phosphotransferase family protein [Stappiaceae bacterium]